MDTAPVISDAEMQRRAQTCAQIYRDDRTHSKNLLWRKVFYGLRRMAIFLLGAVIVILVFTHRDEIARATAQKIRMIVSHVQKRDESSEIRKNALTYEKEVEEVVGK
jgi:ribonucleotide reductase beta subunit family protein with ferritin-like domain